MAASGGPCAKKIKAYLLLLLFIIIQYYSLLLIIVCCFRALWVPVQVAGAAGVLSAGQEAIKAKKASKFFHKGAVTDGNQYRK